MKKLIATLSLIFTILCVCNFTACGETNIIGTWKFHHAYGTTSGGATLDYSLGDSMGGIPLTEDFYVYTFRNNGKGSYSSTLEGKTNIMTWVKNGNTIGITSKVGGVELYHELTIGGQYLLKSESGVTVYLKKS